MKDLFEHYDEQPIELKKIVDNWSQRLDRGLSYKQVAEFFNECDAIGYTFDSGLDAKPYGLRLIGVDIDEIIYE